MDDVAQPQGVESHEHLKYPEMNLNNYVHAAQTTMCNALCQDEQCEITWHCFILSLRKVNVVLIYKSGNGYGDINFPRRLEKYAEAIAGRLQ